MKTDRNEKIKLLKLNFLANNIEEFVTRFTKDPYATFDWWIDRENQENKRSSELRRLKAAKLGKFISFKDFKWSWPDSPSNLKTQIENLMKNDFVKAKRNVLFFGAEGVGKTSLAKILAQHSILNGYSAYFTTTADMLTDLNGAEHVYLRKKIINKYTNPSVLILDEVGYSSYNECSADNLYQIISARYEKEKSTIITSNLAFQDWPNTFGKAQCTAAIIDRLIHHATAIDIKARSFRLKEHKEEKSQNKEKGKK